MATNDERLQRLEERERASVSSRDWAAAFIDTPAGRMLEHYAPRAGTSAGGRVRSPLEPFGAPPLMLRAPSSVSGSKRRFNPVDLYKRDGALKEEVGTDFGLSGPYFGNPAELMKGRGVLLGLASEKEKLAEKTRELLLGGKNSAAYRRAIRQDAVIERHRQKAQGLDAKALKREDAERAKRSQEASRVAKREKAVRSKNNAKIANAFKSPGAAEEAREVKSAIDATATNAKWDSRLAKINLYGPRITNVLRTVGGAAAKVAAVPILLTAAQKLIGDRLGGEDGPFANGLKLAASYYTAVTTRKWGKQLDELARKPVKQKKPPKLDRRYTRNSRGMKGMKTKTPKGEWPGKRPATNSDKAKVFLKGAANEAKDKVGSVIRGGSRLAASPAGRVILRAGGKMVPFYGQASLINDGVDLLGRYTDLDIKDDLKKSIDERGWSAATPGALLSTGVGSVASWIGGGVSDAVSSLSGRGKSDSAKLSASQLRRAWMSPRERLADAQTWGRNGLPKMTPMPPGRGGVAGPPRPPRFPSQERPKAGRSATPSKATRKAPAPAKVNVTTPGPFAAQTQITPPAWMKPVAPKAVPKPKTKTKPKPKPVPVPLQLHNNVQLTLDGRMIFNSVARQNQLGRLAR
jgi:hypothetical protein